MPLIRAVPYVIGPLFDRAHGATWMVRAVKSHGNGTPGPASLFHDLPRPTCPIVVDAPWETA